MAAIIDGRAISSGLRAKIAREAAEFSARRGVTPGLAVVMVGDDPASRVYVRNKKRACEEAGLYSEIFELPGDTPADALLALIARLNSDPKIHGILVQLPLPEQFDPKEVILAIDPKKDVDAFSPFNTGLIMSGGYKFLPCTPAGVMAMLDYSGIRVEGKECVVVGRSNIVGKPMALLLLEANGTVTVCHSRTKNLGEVCRRADILVAAAGIPGLIKADMVKPGAVVVDVGMNRLPDGRLTGDVDFDAVKDVASYVTPVPGGVGPMTITMLLMNTLTAAKLSAGEQ